MKFTYREKNGTLFVRQQSVGQTCYIFINILKVANHKILAPQKFGALQYNILLIQNLRYRYSRSAISSMQDCCACNITQEIFTRCCSFYDV